MRARTQRAQQRIFRVRRPAGQNQRQHTNARNRQHKQQANVDVGDHGPVRPKRNHGENDEGGGDGDVRREEKDPAIGFLRNEVFLGQQLDAVSNWLQQSPGTNAHRSQPRLHERGNLSFQISGIRDPAGDERDHQPNLDERPDDMVDRVRAEKFQQQIVNEIDWSKEKHYYRLFSLCVLCVLCVSVVNPT